MHDFADDPVESALLHFGFSRKILSMISQDKEDPRNDLGGT